MLFANPVAIIALKYYITSSKQFMDNSDETNMKLTFFTVIRNGKLLQK